MLPLSFMFTGIVEEAGVVEKITPQKNPSK
jgi:riboflavin synthase alpha subunit